jgi:hypothetical protein
MVFDFSACIPLGLNFSIPHLLPNNAQADLEILGKVWFGKFILSIGFV